MEKNCGNDRADETLMRKPAVPGLARFVNALGYSIRGFRAVWRHEAAFRLELILAVILLPAAFFIAESVYFLLSMIASLFLVIICELFNSAIETIVDRIGHENHILSGQAKDIGSAAVLTSIILALVTWGVVLYARFAS